MLPIQLRSSTSMVLRDRLLEEDGSTGKKEGNKQCMTPISLES
jgi:hypothetical protein